MEETSLSGLRIKRFREKNNYSQEELARLLGVTRRTISRWEQNSSKPSSDELSRIAKIIGVTEDELLSGEDEIPSANALERLYDGVDNLVSGQETITESIKSNRDEYGKRQDELIKELQTQNKLLLSKLDEQSNLIESYKEALDLSLIELRHKKIRTIIIAITCICLLTIIVITWVYVMNYGISNEKYIEGAHIMSEQSSFDIEN